MITTIAIGIFIIVVVLLVWVASLPVATPISKVTPIPKATPIPKDTPRDVKRRLYALKKEFESKYRAIIPLQGLFVNRRPTTEDYRVYSKIYSYLDRGTRSADMLLNTFKAQALRDIDLVKGTPDELNTKILLIEGERIVVDMKSKRTTFLRLLNRLPK